MSLSVGWYHIIPVADFYSMLDNVSDPAMRSSISSVFTRTIVTDSYGTHDVMVCLDANYEGDGAWANIDPDGSSGDYEDFPSWIADMGWQDQLHPVSGGMGGDI